MTQVVTNVPAVNGQAKSLSHSERFTNEVIKEFSANAGSVSLTPFQKRLCQNYFISIDLRLRDLEAKRLAKSEQYRDPLAFTWANVNMQKLAQDVVIFSSVGLDPTQPNHINPIPYKNNKTGKYDMTFIIGYKGTELKAKKYALEVPADVIVELVYEKDKFIPHKKDMNNPVESYEFVMSSEMDRGEITGGFYYLVFDDEKKNKLKTFSRKDILKRKPKSASAEFWGGTKDVWEKDEAGRNKKTGTEEVEGWLDEMAYKTIYKAAYSSLTIDSEKIDSNYVELMMREDENKLLKVTEEIENKANKTELGFDDAPPAEVIQTTTNEEKNPAQQTTIAGPGF